MSVAAGEVYETPFTEDIDAFSGRDLIACDILSLLKFSDRVFVQVLHIDLDIKVAGVAENGSILHYEEVFVSDDAKVSGHGYKEISYLCCLMHRHYGKAVHDSFNSLDGIDLRDYYFCSKTLRAHSDALAAPAIACHDHILSCHDEVGGPVDAVPDGLACAVAVVKEVLHVCVIYHDHREMKLPLPVHGVEPHYSCGSLLAAADDILQLVSKLCVQHMNEVTAVVYYDIAVVGEDCLDIRKIILLAAAVMSKD